MDFKDLVKTYHSYDEKFYGKIKEYNSSQEIEKNRLVCPMLLDELPDFRDAEIKVMIFGQEVNRWNLSDEGKFFYEDFDNDIADFMDLYKGYMSIFQNTGFRNHTPFNAEYLRIQKLLKKTFTNYNVGIMWNNLIKLSALEMNTGIKLYDNIPAVKESSLLIKSELECFKPDIILFYTGPNYDFVINTKEIFNITNKNPVNGFSDKELLSLEIPGVSLALRTYHPGYLSRKPELFEKIKQKIDSQIVQVIEKRVKQKI